MPADIRQLAAATADRRFLSVLDAVLEAGNDGRYSQERWAYVEFAHAAAKWWIETGRAGQEPAGSCSIPPRNRIIWAWANATAANRDEVRAAIGAQDAHLAGCGPPGRVFG